MIDLSASQRQELELYRDRLARVKNGEVWGGDHPGPYTAEEKAQEIARIEAIITNIVMGTNLKQLLMQVSLGSTSEELKANLAAVVAQCEQDYADAEQCNIDDKSELIATSRQRQGRLRHHASRCRRAGSHPRLLAQMARWQRCYSRLYSAALGPSLGSYRFKESGDASVFRSRNIPPLGGGRNHAA